MLPFLKTLDECSSVPVDPCELKSGDVVVYDGGGGELFIHRVLNVDKDKKLATIKGDNTPSDLQEEVPFDRIIEKVISVNKGGKVLDFKNPFQKISQRFIAFLSRHNMTPGLVRHRYIDPVLLTFARSSVYVFFRKMFYKDISYSKTKDGQICRIHAFVGGVESAKAVIGYNEKKGVLIDSYIRYRDRNHFFAEQFMHKVIEESDKEFGSDKRIHVRDKNLKNLISSKDAFFFNDRVFFK